MNDIRLAQLSMFISKAKEIGNPNYPPMVELFDEIIDQRTIVNEIQKAINAFPVSCKLDEDIPDDDKEAAYKMGYADAIADIAESIKAITFNKEELDRPQGIEPNEQPRHSRQPTRIQDSK